MGKIVSQFQLKTAVTAIGELFFWLGGLSGAGGVGVRPIKRPFHALRLSFGELVVRWAIHNYVFFFRIQRFPVDICSYLTSDLGSPCKNVH